MTGFQAPGAGVPGSVGRPLPPYAHPIKEPPDHRLKLPFFVLYAAVLVALIVTGHHLVVAVPLLAMSIVAIVLIARGRNPRWLRGPFDQAEARRRRR